MEDHFYEVSSRLYNVLDWIGASNERRGQYEERAMVLEVLHTLVRRYTSELAYGTYIFGSSHEGTTTPGLNSDIDVLHCYNTSVVERISDAPRHGLSLVMVRDESTKPGYVKLQTVFNGVPHTIYQRETNMFEDTDQEGRICVKHAAGYIRYPLLTGRNGPAASCTGAVGRTDIDTVPAYICSHIPTFAQSWVSRQRRYSWPHPHQIHNMKQNGCFFVGVNHPSSQYAPIEWRLSFSLQERELMLTLNPTQHKCYVLLKMIKKDIIHKQAPKSISSYHCKTCLFYVIENTPPDFWTRRNLLECSRACIKLLLQWTREQTCPNYFIPDENMFDRLKPETLRQVKLTLEDILNHWCRFLWSLTCDDIGAVLYDVLFGSGPDVLCVRNWETTKHGLSLYMDIQDILLGNSKRLVQGLTFRSSTELLGKLYMFMLILNQTHRVTEHTVQETMLAITYFMPHLHLQIAQCLASIMLNTRGHLLKIMFGAFKYCMSESRDCDLISTKLIVASFCLQSDRFETCEKYLHDCEIAFRPHVVSACDCIQTEAMDNRETPKQLIKHLNMDTFTFRQLRSCITGCLTFLPCQSNLVPPALHYEMYRSVNTPPEFRDIVDGFWFEWIVVDSKVYMYFLQYTLYAQTNKPACKQDALDNLVRVIRTDKAIGHTETAYNLLGWIYRQEHQFQKAMECFLTSLRIRPIHNAAKWHMLGLINSLYRSGSGSGHLC